MALLAAAALLASGLTTVEPAARPARAAASAAATVAANTTEKPDLISARVAASLSGRRVEATDERTTSTTTWANPDGTLTTEAAAGPIRVRRGADWVDVDTSLRAVDGVVRPVAVPAAVTFSAGGNGNLASLSSATRAVAMSWPGTLPTPILAGDTATYPGVVPGGDLRLTASRTGFEFSVVLRTRPTAPLTLRLPVRLTGLRLVQTASGDLRFTDPAGVIVAAAPAPRMWGATIDPRTGDPVRSAAVATTVTQAADGAVLTLTPDPAFLADPTVSYPLLIDPTLTQTADTWVQTGIASNQMGSGELRTGTFDGGATVARSLLKFDTAPIAGVHVLSATLKAYEWHSYSCSTRQVAVVRLTSDWNPATVVWSNQPTSKASSRARPPSPTASPPPARPTG